MTRETVTAKALASSPPAPSPSRRTKKRTSPPPTLQEMRRLANKQIKHLRGLLAGTERPYPGPWGLEGSISEIAGFVKEAHSAWMVVGYRFDPHVFLEDGVGGRMRVRGMGFFLSVLGIFFILTV